MEPKKENDIVELKPGQVVVDQKTLQQVLDKQAEMELEIEENKNKQAGLEALLNEGKDSAPEGKLREKKNFEPKFRTVKLRQYPFDANNPTELTYVIGISDRKAFQEVDSSGITRQVVDMIEIIPLPKSKDEKPVAMKVKLLDFMNNGIQKNCKILSVKREEDDKVPTGEEIDVTVFDPAHGLTATGDKVDGYTSFAKIKYEIQIPGVAESIWIDAKYCNL